jgi:hypothetical protein
MENVSAFITMISPQQISINLQNTSLWFSLIEDISINSEPIQKTLPKTEPIQNQPIKVNLWQRLLEHKFLPYSTPLEKSEQIQTIQAQMISDCEREAEWKQYLKSHKIKLSTIASWIAKKYSSDSILDNVAVLEFLANYLQVSIIYHHVSQSNYFHLCSGKYDYEIALIQNTLNQWSTLPSLEFKALGLRLDVGFAEPKVEKIVIQSILTPKSTYSDNSVVELRELVESRGGIITKISEKTGKPIKKLKAELLDWLLIADIMNRSEIKH